MSLASIRLALLVALAAASVLSVFASQLVLAAASLLLLGLCASGRLSFPRTPIDVPIVALVVWSLLSASFAVDPGNAHEHAKKLLLFAVFYVAVAGINDDASREKVATGLVLSGLALSALMVMEAVFLGQSDLEHRPRGFLGHYMTAAGLVMTTLLVAIARLAFGSRPERPRLSDLLPIGAVLTAVTGLVLARHFELAPVLAMRVAVVVVIVTAIVVALRQRAAASLVTTASLLLLPLGTLALVVSRTRNAWLGALAGVSLVAFLKAPRLLAFVGVGVVALLVVQPAAIRDRLTVTDASSRDRYYMWQAGVDMILERPVFGQGPGMVEYNYSKYRWAEAPNARAPHLHNNAIQIAAERGLPGLVFFLWWVIAIPIAAWREFRASRRGSPAFAWPAAAALAVVGALLVAGLFEYNLGDSEVVMTALIVCSFPYTVRRERLLPA